MYSEYHPSTSDYFINSSNLVKITQQKREQQRIDSNQITKQVGNVLEIVPSTDIPCKPPPISSQELKARRKALREKKRNDKVIRKNQLRNEIQRIFDSGISITDSEDDELTVETFKAELNHKPGILKKHKHKNAGTKRVVYGDGLLPNDVSDLDENAERNVLIKKSKRKILRKKMRKFKENRSSSHKNEILGDSNKISFPMSMENSQPPIPPSDNPPKHLIQPRLKKITPDLYATFAINPEPIYFYLQRIHINGFVNTSRQPIIVN